MMPTGEFPDVRATTGLYQRSQHRARARKTRNLLAAGAVAGILGAVGAVGLMQPADPKSTLISTAGSPPPSASQQLAPPTDRQLISMVHRCDSNCAVVGRVQTQDGNTFAIIGTRMGGSDPALPGTVSFVLANGTHLLTEMAPDTSNPVYADHRVPLRADSTGNVIVPTVFGNGLAFLPFRAVGGRIALVQGSFQSPAIVGDNNSVIVDSNGDGQLEIVTVDHQATSSGVRIYTYQSWHWENSVYRAQRCTLNARAPSTPCGLPRNPAG